MARGAWLALLAATLSLAAGAASGEPIVPGARGAAPIWEEHGAGRTDGLALGAYPLPAQPAQGDGREAEMDGSTRERWLHRHYQWLRALNELLKADGATVQRQTSKPVERAPFASAVPHGALRLGDTVVLYAGDEGGERIAPHLLDDGGRYEDPEIGLKNGETVDFMVRDRLSIASPKVVAEFFGPLIHSAHAAFGGVLAGADRQRAPHFQPEAEFAAPSTDAKPAGPARQRPPQQDSVTGFVKGIAKDILSAPTTYLLTLVALLAWLILRATISFRV